MNPAHLLAHFERLADAPDAIPRLRQFILDLAVRGKLVEQNASDEPASELLERIAAERARQVQAGKIKELKPTAPIGDSEVPIEVPNRWAWIRLRELGSLGGGMTPSMSRAEFWGGDVLWVSPKDMRADELVSSELKITEEALKQTRLQVYPPGSLFMVVRSGILKRRFPVAVNRLPAAANQDMKVLVPFICEQDRYLQIMFRGLTDFILKNLVKTGTTVQSIKYAEFEEQPFPLPPLAEQHRIVVKVDELMALCDRLEVAREKREGRRDRLVEASLHRLSQPADEDGKGTFRADARFYLNNLPRLTTRPENVKQLRQTILNLAVGGRLVPQDPKDEPASELLDRIRAEKARVIQSGLYKRQKPLVENKEDLALPCPERWERIALGTVCNYVTSGSRGWSEYYSSEGAAFIRAQNIRFGVLDLSSLARVKLPRETEGVRTQIRSGDLLVVITGAGVTNPALLDVDVGEGYVSQHVGLLKVTDPSLSRWLLICLMAPAGARAELERCAYGAGRPGLNLDNLRSLGIPLPPLAEQRRIIAKVDALMALCDRLEASLAETEADSRRLLKAVLHEALEPAETALEAAE